MRPPIGFPVQWYAHANKNNEPQAGVVLAVSGDVLVIETVDTVGQRRVRRDQRHISDPLLAKSLQWRIDHGAWDWVPGLFVSVVQEPVAELMVDNTPIVPGSVPGNTPEASGLPEHLLYKEKADEKQDEFLPPTSKEVPEKPLRGRAPVKA